MSVSCVQPPRPQSPYTLSTETLISKEIILKFVFRTYLRKGAIMQNKEPKTVLILVIGL